MPPNGPLFCRVDGSGIPIGPERIAKIVGEVMQSCGIDTKAFPPHSLRGSSATSALLRGVPADVVRGRGGWISQAAFEPHYARQHQGLDWEAVLAGASRDREPAAAGSSGVFPFPSTKSSTSTTRYDVEETGGREREGENPNPSHAVPRAPLQGFKCIVCNAPVRLEPAMESDEGLTHYRCLPPEIRSKLT